MKLNEISPSTTSILLSKSVSLSTKSSPSKTCVPSALREYFDPEDFEDVDADDDTLDRIGIVSDSCNDGGDDNEDRRFCDDETALVFFSFWSDISGNSTVSSDFRL